MSSLSAGAQAIANHNQIRPGVERAEGFAHLQLEAAKRLLKEHKIDPTHQNIIALAQLIATNQP